MLRNVFKLPRGERSVCWKPVCARTLNHLLMTLRCSTFSSSFQIPCNHNLILFLTRKISHLELLIIYRFKRISFMNIKTVKTRKDWWHCFENVSSNTESYRVFNDKPKSVDLISTKILAYISQVVKIDWIFQAQRELMVIFVAAVWWKLSGFATLRCAYSTQRSLLVRSSINFTFWR